MIIASEFRPAPGLRNPHLQTLYAAALRPLPKIKVRRERVDLPDGDFIDLDWADGAAARPGAPIVLLLHGLTGSIQSKYARGILLRLEAQGWRVALMHFRGASEEPNRLPRGYHSGETGDFGFVLRRLQGEYQGVPFAVVGFSLGGNVLLKWLGEQGAAAGIATAVAVSVPFDLRGCAAAIGRGFSRLYQARLLRAMRGAARLKFSRIQPPFPLPALDELRDFFAYDAAMTAPLHGFASVDEYYDLCSSRQFLRRIEVPTLVIHALDDPFMSPEVVPTEAELSPQVRLELSPHGGHVGFVAAAAGGTPRYWLEKRIPEHLAQFLAP